LGVDFRVKQFCALPRNPQEEAKNSRFLLLLSLRVPIPIDAFLDFYPFF